MTSSSHIEAAERISDEELAVRVRDNDAEAASELIRRFSPLVRSAAKHYFGASLENDDIMQEGLLALVLAAYSYSPDRDASFRTYSAVCISNRLRTVVKAQSAEKHIPLNTYVPIDEVELASCSTPESIYLDAEYTDELFAAVNRELSELEKKVLSLFLFGNSYREAAEKLGISEKSVANALQRARKKLQRTLNKA